MAEQTNHRTNDGYRTEGYKPIPRGHQPDKPINTQPPKPPTGGSSAIPPTSQSGRPQSPKS